MGPILSVIVPIYNTKEQLSRCIDSILSQSFSDFELLLVDDGSTDGSSVVCDAYSAKDNRVRVFHKANGGVSSARNVGLENVNGQWLTFLDSDDWIEEDYFQVPFDSDVDILYQNRVFSDGRLDGFIPEQKAKDGDFLDFLVENAHSNIFRISVCFFFRYSIIKNHQIRYEEGVRLAEDRLFVMDYYKYCRSIQVQTNSRYVYNVSDQWKSKYILSWQDLDCLLGLLMDRYDALPVKSPEIVTTFQLVFHHVNPDEKCLRVRQALSKNVLRYKKIFWLNQGWKKKAKYYLLSFFSSIIPRAHQQVFSIINWNI